MIDENSTKEDVLEDLNKDGNLNYTQKTTSYKGFYRNIVFEIAKNYISNTTRYWGTYYICIDIHKIPEKYNPNSFWLENIYDDKTKYSFYDYDKHEKLSSIYFYSGITFYSKIYVRPETFKRIKVGCDFNHLWDEETNYTYDDISKNVIKTIDSLYEEMPEYGNVQKK